MSAINPQTKINVQLKFPGIEKAYSGVLFSKKSIPPYCEYDENKIIQKPKNMRMNCNLSVRTMAENPPVKAYAKDRLAPNNKAQIWGMSHK